jgi:hypothetical protein
LCFGYDINKNVSHVWLLAMNYSLPDSAVILGKEWGKKIVKNKEN